jgi:hypothetical protein
MAEETHADVLEEIFEKKLLLFILKHSNGLELWRIESVLENIRQELE